MSKEKREREREYNGKRGESGHYDKYRITMGRRESTNTMASIGGTYIIMRTVWQRHNASRSLNFISLCILFGNVAMYQNYIHDIIAKYIILIRRMSLKKSFITLIKLSYIGACIFDLLLVLVEQFICIPEEM